RKFPYGWDLNIYRGCEHKCQYCYAMYSHEYLNDDNFAENIYIKTNIVEKLEKELSSKTWKREIINIGGVTDSYQPCEANYKLMPEILKLLIKYKTPAIISTKSDLVLRDYDLIDELSKITYINIAASITTTDEKIRKLIEPGAAESLKRFEMLKTLRQTNASVGLHVMPIIPYLTDSFDNMDSLCQYARDAKVHYMLPGTMYLRGKTRLSFFGFIQTHFPHLYHNFLDLYKKGGATQEYKDNLYKMVNELRDKYQLSKSYSKPMKEKLHKN
ncbi:MAG: radical SAM protein, partial [Marinilabiliaceae bacterium]|nr:radical SAM protein [Marinilabiliaceae bacterium]